MHRKKEKIYFEFVRLAVAAVCKSKVISLVANIHASARAIYKCVECSACLCACCILEDIHNPPYMLVSNSLS
jgi:hypothetical protein